MRPPVVPPTELVSAAPVDVAALAAVLGGAWTVELGDARPADRWFLDSFEGRLAAAGATLERRGGTRSGPPRAFVLTEPGRSPVEVEARTPRDDRVLPEELPAGPLRERLAELLGLRAALPLVRVRSRRRDGAVRNADGKIVVRIAHEEPEVVVRGRPGVALAPRVTLRPVLGYDKALGRVTGALRDGLGLREPERRLVEDAVAAASVDGAPGVRGGARWTAKVALPLERDERARHAVVAYCAALAEKTTDTLPGTLTDLDTEFLHDFRVSVRRTRSVLREMQDVLAPRDTQRARDFLKWVQLVSGPSRDLDVQLLEWDALAAGAPDDLEPLRALLERRRAAAHRRMRRDLRGARFREEWSWWEAFLAAGGSAGPDSETPIGELAAARIRSVYRRMVRDGTAIAPETPAQALHDLRKRGKELRYLLELFGGLWAAETVKPLVSSLKRLQDVLGRFQDREVQAHFLRGLGPELAEGSEGPAALMALGVVVERLEADQAAARGEFADQFAAFAAPGRRRLVKETFRA